MIQELIFKWHSDEIVSKEKNKDSSKPQTLEDGVEKNGVNQYDSQHLVQLHNPPVDTVTFNIEQFFLLIQNHIFAPLFIVVKDTQNFLVLSFKVECKWNNTG